MIAKHRGDMQYAPIYEIAMHSPACYILMNNIKISDDNFDEEEQCE